MLNLQSIAWVASFCFLIGAHVKAQETAVRIAVFDIDASPAIGSPVAYANCREVLDPLRAKGIVLLSDAQPIVLCAVDWLGISHDSRVAWQTGLAAAAGTTPDRVAIHTLHQHDGIYGDMTAESLLAEVGLGGKFFDSRFEKIVIERVADSIVQSIERAQLVTQIGFGEAKVDRIASNRRILGEDGKVKLIRWSKTVDPEAIAAPEGLVDPFLKMITFWNGDKPIVALSYYATHPQSYYGEGDVTSEFIGIGRAQREKETGVTHVHFNGASGNITAGKYNDGSKENRPVMAKRFADGMKAAWEATHKSSFNSGDVGWQVAPVQLDVRDTVQETDLRKTLHNESAAERERLRAACCLAWVGWCKNGNKLQLSCLRLGKQRILHLPGEAFVEFQLAAQESGADQFNVCVAAYGEYGTGYIGTEISYSQGGYETGPLASLVAPNSEKRILAVVNQLLKE
jgi:hypothetical protein